MADGVEIHTDLLPESDDARDLGAVGQAWKDLHLDGVAYVDELRADQLGAALDANSQAITNINVDSGAIDGTVIGANSAAAGDFTALAATSFDMQGGDISDAGDVALDSLSAAATDMDFVMSNNSATALEIKDGSTTYMTFDSSTGQEGIYVAKELELQAGALVSDDQQVIFGDDDDAAVEFDSANDMLKLSAVHSNQHGFRNIASAQMRSGVDVVWYGAAANEQMEYALLITVSSSKIRW